MLDKFYFKRTFDDFDDLAVNLRKWNVEISQIERGKFTNTVQQLSTGETLITQINSHGKAFQNGETPPGRTFCLLGNKKSRIEMKKQQVTPNNLVICSPGGELDVSTQSDPVNVFTISVSDKLLFGLMEDRGLEAYQKSISQSELLALSAAQMQQLRITCHNYFKWLDTFPEDIQAQTFQNEVRSNLLIPLITSIIASQPTLLDSANSLSIDRWNRVEEFINLNIDKHIQVHEICQATGVRERTLFRIFKKRFGVTPNSYLKCVRLNRIRKTLKRSTYKKMLISDIANDLGFWHMGDFAADYRTLFGENPSETIKKVFNTNQ